jgi:hypothetical protein
MNMAADAESAHRTGIRYAAELGLVGRVVEVEGRVAAYTLGYPLTLPSPLSGEGDNIIPSPPFRGRGQGEGAVKGEGAVFCILFEIADRNIKGLAQYIFREFCRELESYELINAMDDSGLSGLRQAKLTYHPIQFLESYIIASR